MFSPNFHCAEFSPRTGPPRDVLCHHIARAAARRVRIVSILIGVRSNSEGTPGKLGYLQAEMTSQNITLCRWEYPPRVVSCRGVLTTMKRKRDTKHLD